jgi:eukaryotic-like serine/threonine-protein kinase
MALNAGTCLGPYEILSAIGAGGMGEVYRAKDTRLKRDVAIKVLPDSFATDPERLARFHREAELLAALNHPNIAAVYGLEQAGGTTAIVLELIDGETLADLIARGPLAAGDAWPIARQIAEALEAAHEKGVIHRDLKPANIKVTPDATVKVLDFGLAAAVQGPGVQEVNATHSPTLTLAATRAGVILGTAAYMSPEQASGKSVDKRSDIWSFGVVLWEMLTGKRLFEGETISHTLAFVITKEPDWTALPANTPPSIHRLLRRCLEKDRKRRLPDIGTARLEIDEALTAPSSTAFVTTSSPGLTQSRWRSAAVGADSHHAGSLGECAGLVATLADDDGAHACPTEQRNGSGHVARTSRRSWRKSRVVARRHGVGLRRGEKRRWRIATVRSPPRSVACDWSVGN